jgi:hypothetical protein
MPHVVGHRIEYGIDVAGVERRVELPELPVVVHANAVAAF